MSIHFFQIEFSECLNLLTYNLNEVVKNLNFSNCAHIEKIEDNRINISNVSSSSEKLIINWTEVDVEKWIEEKNIQSSILNNIRPCDGKLLFELFSIKIQAPDYFKESLMANQDIANQFSLRDYAVFFNELKKLFLD